MAQHARIWAIALASAAILATGEATAQAPAGAARPAAAAALPVATTDTDAPVRVDAKVSNPKPLFGERIELQVTLRHKPNVRVFFPSKPDLRPLLVDTRDAGRAETQTIGGEVVETIIVPALAVRSGSFKLPAVEVPWHEQDSAGNAGKSGTVTLPVLRVHVQSQFAGDTNVQAAPLPPPRALIEENLPMEIGLLVLAMMTVSALATALALKVYRDRAARMAPKPKVPAHTVAIRQLDALDTSDRITTMEPASVFAELSAILREYLGGRYNFLALDMTSTELLAQLKGTVLRGVQLTEISAFTDLSDLVKFARVPASPEELRAESQFVRKVVERTMLTYEEQEQARRAEAERLARQKRLRLQVMAPLPLRIRAFAVDAFAGALATALLAWVAIDTSKQSLFDVAFLLAPLWLIVRDAIGPQSPGKALVGLQIADNAQDDGPTNRAFRPEAREDDGLATAQMATTGARLLRNLAFGVPLIGLVVESVTCLNLPESRRLGDQWAGTRIIDAQVAARRGKPSWAPAVLLLVMAAVLLLLPFAMGGRPT